MPNNKKIITAEKSTKKLLDDLYETVKYVRDCYKSEIVAEKNSEKGILVFGSKEISENENSDEKEFMYLDISSKPTFYEIITDKTGRKRIGNKIREIDDLAKEEVIQMGIIEIDSVVEQEDGEESNIKFLNTEYLDNCKIPKEGKYKKYSINGKTYYLINAIDIDKVEEITQFYKSEVSENGKVREVISANEMDNASQYLSTYKLNNTCFLVGVEETVNIDEKTKVKNTNCVIFDVVPISTNNNQYEDEKDLVKLLFAMEGSEDLDITENMLQYIIAVQKNAEEDNSKYLDEIKNHYENNEIEKFEDFLDGKIVVKNKVSSVKYDEFYNKMRTIYGYDGNTNSIFFKAMRDISADIKEEEILYIIDNYAVIRHFLNDTEKELTVENIYNAYQYIKNVEIDNNGNLTVKNLKENNKINDLLQIAMAEDGLEEKLIQLEPESANKIEKLQRTKSEIESRIKKGKYLFEKDIIEEEIKLPQQYRTEVSKEENAFLNDYEKDIILDMLQDDTVPDVFLSGQMRMLKLFDKSLAQNYQLNKNVRRQILSTTYEKVENKNISIENRYMINEYIKKQLVPREIKLEKILTLHNVSDKNKIETVFETEKKSLTKELVGDKVHIYLNYKVLGKKIDLGEISNDVVARNDIIDIKTLEAVQKAFKDNPKYTERIDSLYNEYFQVSSYRKQNLKTIQEEYKKNAKQILDNKGAIVIFNYNKKGKVVETKTFYKEEEKLVSETLIDNQWQAHQEKDPEEDISSIIKYLNEHKDTAIPMTIEKDKASMIDYIQKNGDIAYYELLAAEAKNKVPDSKNTFKDSRNSLQIALSEGNYIVLSNYNDPLPTNHTINILKTNKFGETVCLTVSKNGPYLFDNIKEDDVNGDNPKFKVESRILNVSELNELLKQNTRKNTSTRIFTPEVLNTSSKWDVNNNKVDIDGFFPEIKTVVDAVNGYVTKQSAEYANMKGSNVRYIAYENEDSSIKTNLRIQKTGDSKYEIKMLKKTPENEYVVTIKAKTVGTKFVIDEEAYKNNQSNLKNLKNTLDKINIDLIAPNNQVSINRHKEVMEEENNRENIDFYFKYIESCSLIDKCYINSALKKAESDNTSNIEAAYQNNILGRLIEKDFKLQGKTIGEQEKNVIKKMNPSETKDLDEALDLLKLEKEDVDKLKNRIEKEMSIMDGKTSFEDMVKTSQEILSGKVDKLEIPETIFSETEEKDNKKAVSIPNIILTTQEYKKAFVLMSVMADAKEFNNLINDKSIYSGIDIDKEIDSMSKEKLYELYEKDGSSLKRLLPDGITIDQIEEEVKKLDEEEKIELLKEQLKDFRYYVIETDEKNNKFPALYKVLGRNDDKPALFRQLFAEDGALDNASDKIKSMAEKTIRKNENKLTYENNGYQFEVTIGWDYKGYIDATYVEIKKDGKTLEEGDELLKVYENCGFNVTNEKMEERTKIIRFLKEYVSEYDDSKKTVRPSDIENFKNNNDTELKEGFESYISHINGGEKIISKQTKAFKQLYEASILYKLENNEKLENREKSQITDNDKNNPYLRAEKFLEEEKDGQTPEEYIQERINFLKDIEKDIYNNEETTSFCKKCCEIQFKNFMKDINEKVGTDTKLFEEVKSFIENNSLAKAQMVIITTENFDNKKPLLCEKEIIKEYEKYPKDKELTKEERKLFGKINEEKKDKDIANENG